MKHSFVNNIDKQFGTPFYLMYPDIFKQNINGIREAFKELYDDVIVGYSFKTNYVPAISNLAIEEGCYAEVVSGMEYDMAIKLGFDSKKIIFNGPIKRAEELYKAMDLGSIVNLDSEYEVDDVIEYKKANPDKQLNIGLRVNIELKDKDGKSSVQNGLRYGRFGFPSSILSSSISKLKEAGIKIVSIHGHTSSTDRATENYAFITRYMLSVCEKYNLYDIRYFNIGGGFFGAPAKGTDVKGKPSYNDYAKTVVEILLDNEWFKNIKPFIVIEPGVSVVANVFSVVSKVYQNKKIDDKNFVVVDTSVFEVKPSMHQNNLPFALISKKQSDESKRKVVDVVGSTCMEKDVILRDVEIEDTEKGDYIIFNGVGAYTIVFTPDFINYIPPIISIDSDEKTKLIRRRKDINDVLNTYILE